jgi:hypothetical protein
MASAKNSHAVGPRVGTPATEYKLPIGKSRTSSFEFPVSSFQFRISSFQGQGRWAERKKIYGQTRQVIENKG